jgi:hypothetical protein
MEDGYDARKDVPVTIKYMPQQIPFSGFGGEKAPSGMGKISPVGVPSTPLGTGSSDSAPQALWHAINLRGAPLRMTILWEL